VGGNIVRKETYRERKSFLSSIQVSINSFMQMAADGAGKKEEGRGGEARRKDAVVEILRKVISLTSSID
jgi:hypothetical protein